MIRVPVSLLAASLPRCRLQGRPRGVVTRLCADSREVGPGDLYACVPGRHQDGHAFAAEAVNRGAAALLIERPVSGVDPARTSVLEVPKVTEALQFLAPRFYDYPSLDLALIGVTGTNGKTTITYLVRAILEQLGTKAKPRPVGVIGTIAHWIGPKCLKARNTTPLAWDLQQLFFDMRRAGCDTAVMEVSSHALAENRIEGCEFDVAVFSNLSHEHLDFHRTLDAYAAAKQKLFSRLVRPGVKGGKKTAVINRDDPYGQRMANAAAGARIIGYGLRHSAEVTAQDVQMSAGGSRFWLKTPIGRVRVNLPLLGAFNIQNALAAAGTALALDIPLAAIKRGLESVHGVAGRLERVRGKQPFTVVVDFAHTPAALEQVLSAVRPLTRRRVIAVFGCGGERDRTKRGPMGETAARLADEVILTADNPRREDPALITQEILAGCRRAHKEPRIELDRTRAVRLALGLARAGDVIVLAGKGHEQMQIFKDRTVPYSDLDTVRRELTRLGYKPGPAPGRRACKA